jgi:hypothetical protein
MANLGEITELVTAKELYLEVGSDQYIGIEDIRPFHQLFDEVIPDTAGDNFYSQGTAEDWMTVTLKFTEPEYSAFHTSSTADAAGTMTDTTWKIIAISTSGTTTTITVPGYVKNITGPIKQRQGNYATVELFIRITGGYTIA